MRCGKIDKIRDNVLLYHGDCLEEMRKIPDGSVDFILTDPPYGTTACKWDSIIPFEPMWDQINRVAKTNGAVVLFGSEPFTSCLICSNIKKFKYDIVWDKVNCSSGILAKKRPLKSHENILVFYNEQPTYNPQMTQGTAWHRAGAKDKKMASIYGDEGRTAERKSSSDTTTLKYPKTILTISNADNTKRFHPTQKPVPLLESLIRTYTNEGDTVLDFTMGSGSAGVACVNTSRNFIGIELDFGYYSIACKRIADAQTEGQQLSLSGCL